MPRMGYFIAIAISVVSAVVFPWPADADHVAGEEPYFTCRASVARATVLNGSPIPPIEPLVANLNREECAEDTGGLPTIALPPPPAAPVISAGLVQAATEILCATDDPNPAVDPGDNDVCDAGRRSFEQQVLSTADAADVRILLGGLDIRAQAANTSARASCNPVTNQPVLSSSSQVINLTINGNPIQIPQGGEPFVLDLGVAKLILNERLGTEGQYPDNAASGFVTRRAIHVQVPGGATSPPAGTVADVVVGESTADFHGDVCPEGRIVVKKETVPEQDPNTTTFPFTSPNLAPTSFNLTDDQQREFAEVLPGTYTITETAAPGQYSLAAINCAENRTENSTTSVPNRAATINVGPGETVTCTFINAICPPGSALNNTGECVILQVRCPDGSTLNNIGQCIIDATTCPPNSMRPPSMPNGPCIANITCPTGSSGPNSQGQCVSLVVSCPPDATLVGGRCVGTNIVCPTGTTFNPINRTCVEGPVGGTLVPLNPRITEFFRASPCIGQGFGPLVGIFGTNGPDRITGTNNADRIFALGGDDRVSGGRGNDCVEGGSGRDVIDGSNGADFLLGGTGNDQVNGGPGNDRFEGGSGRDNMSGGSQNDRMNGGGGRDRMNGGFGNDRLVGGSGNDGIHTGNGRDRVFAGSGNDIVNAATRGPAAFVDCGPGRKDRVRINRNETRRTRRCEFVDVPRRIRSNNRPQSPR